MQSQFTNKRMVSGEESNLVITNMFAINLHGT